jgi:hypothetical protein
MIIDWTQPVIDARDMDADPLFDSQGRVQACRVGSVVYAPPAFEKLGLRNVAPPKPKPVLIEGWVNFVKASTAYEGGTYWVVRNGAVWTTREWALIEAGKMSDVIGTSFISVMSDGSPAPGGAPDAPWKENSEYWRSKAEALQAEADDLRTHLVKALDVVGAAVAWADRADALGSRANLFGNARTLYDTVRTYQQTPKKTAAEAVANVAEMTGPVKNCETCEQFDYGDQDCNFCRRCRAKDYKFWEAKSHD